jgi:putative peptidoglycan lipid II flippase
MRWGLDSMALVVLPALAALVALARPAVEVVSFGAADTGDGVSLMAAGTASLAVGLFGFGCFRLLAAGWYALDDSRTPAIVGGMSAVAGVVFMVLVAPKVEGAGLVAVLGLGHSAAFTLGAAVLAIGLRRRTGQSLRPRLLLPCLTASAAIGAAMWAFITVWDPSGRLVTAAALLVVTAAGGGAYLALARWRKWVPEERGPLVEAPA